MVTDDFDDLFGGDAPAPPQETRRRRRSAAERLESVVSMKAAASGRGLQDIGGVQALRRPVTINILATVFDHDPQTITRRLIDCPFVEQSGRKLYDFKEACGYIVKPRMTPEQFIKTLNAAKLPPEVNKAFWDAQRSRVKYKIESQEAWETEDVLRVLGEVFMAIKDSFTTITEEMRERAKLTDDQSAMFEAAIDELRGSLREKLVEMPKTRQTTSVFEKPLFGNGGQTADEMPDVLDEGDA